MKKKCIFQLKVSAVPWDVNLAAGVLWTAGFVFVPKERRLLMTADLASVSKLSIASLIIVVKPPS